MIIALRVGPSFYLIYWICLYCSCVLETRTKKKMVFSIWISIFFTCCLLLIRVFKTRKVDQSTRYKEELGRATWLLIHRLCENFPISPTDAQKQSVKELLINLADNYPCGECRIDFQRNTHNLPPECLASRDALIRWAFHFHNEINTKLGKRKYSFRNYSMRIFTDTNSCHDCMLTVT